MKWLKILAFLSLSVMIGLFACNRLTGVKNQSSTVHNTQTNIAATQSSGGLSESANTKNYSTYFGGPTRGAHLMPTLATTANSPSGSMTDHTDVRVYQSINNQSEEHISINPANPSNLLISANANPQGCYVSFDGGSTWQGADQLPNENPSMMAGDPSTAFDANGNAYITTMIYRNVCCGGYYLFKSTDGGSTWNISDSVKTSYTFDKEMIATDHYSSSPYENNLYTTWVNRDNHKIEFDRLTYNGLSAPIQLSGTYEGYGPDVATGPNGNVYVCWEDDGTTTFTPPSKGVMFDKSTDGGQSFNGAYKAFSVNGMDPDGMGADPNFNGTRVNDFPSIAVDLSSSPYQGRIYIAYAEEVNGKSVIRVRFSIDGGSSWNNPVTVSDPNAVQSWFPWISVDPTNGWINIVYYHLNSSSTWYTDTWVAYSFDGGQTFNTGRVSDTAHVTKPFNGSYAGDYIGISAYGGSAWPTWHDERNGTWQVYVSKVDFTAPLKATISGPTQLTNGQQGTWTATASGGQTPYRYHWQYYYVCKANQPNCPGCGTQCGQWYDGGTGPSNTFTRTGNTAYAGVDVKVTVIDGDNNTKTVQAPECVFY